MTHYTVDDTFLSVNVQKVPSNSNVTIIDMSIWLDGLTICARWVALLARGD